MTNGKSTMVMVFILTVDTFKEGEWINKKLSQLVNTFLLLGLHFKYFVTS